LGRFNTAWLFDLGAEVYGWFTAQSTWRASCAALATHLPDGVGQRIVDLGCGPGVSTFELARLRPRDHVAGLDLAGRMLHEAQRRARKAGLAPNRILWLRGDVVALPFADDSVDALTGHSFLYLLPRQTEALAEMLRVLRPGGRLVLMEPNAQAASPRSVVALSANPRHLVSVSLWRPFSRIHGRFTVTSLPARLAAAGFVNGHAEEVLGGLGVLGWAEKPVSVAEP
jgi:ubiquinone/menaquinone biosynthesis C-methylase UbiE